MMLFSLKEIANTGDSSKEQRRVVDLEFDKMRLMNRIASPRPPAAGAT
jgi:hypothetical protein